MKQACLQLTWWLEQVEKAASPCNLTFMCWVWSMLTVVSTAEECPMCCQVAKVLEPQEGPPTELQKGPPIEPQEGPATEPQRGPPTEPQEGPLIEPTQASTS